MRNRRIAILVAAAWLFLPLASSAAPIELVAQLNPGQSGPVYGWSLYLTLEPGFEVGGLIVTTTGFDSFEFNFGVPGVSPLDSVYAIDPLGDGRNILILNSHGTGLSLIAANGIPVHLGTFFSDFSSAAQVSMNDCDLECGGTFVDEQGNVYQVGEFEIRVVPEPSALLLSLPLLLAAAARGSRQT